MPLIAISPDCKEIYETEIRKIIQTAEILSYNVANQTKAALFKRPKDVKDISIVKRQFWSQSEPDFYKAVREIQKAVKAGMETEEIRDSWLRDVGRMTLDIFDDYVSIPLLGEFDPRRAVKARSLLIFSNSRRNPSIRQKLGLTPTEEEIEREEKSKSKKKGK